MLIKTGFKDMHGMNLDSFIFYKNYRILKFETSDSPNNLNKYKFKINYLITHKFLFLFKSFESMTAVENGDKKCWDPTFRNFGEDF